MPGMNEKAMKLLGELNATRSEGDRLDLTQNQLEDIKYSTSVEEAMKIVREVFAWRIKDWEYTEIEKKLGW